MEGRPLFLSRSKRDLQEKQVLLPAPTTVYTEPGTMPGSWVQHASRPVFHHSRHGAVGAEGEWGRAMGLTNCGSDSSVWGLRGTIIGAVPGPRLSLRGPHCLLAWGSYQEVSAHEPEPSSLSSQITESLVKLTLKQQITTPAIKLHPLFRV